jgi:hypothetical protein
MSPTLTLSADDGVSAPIIVHPACSSDIWSTAVNLSSLSDGDIVFMIDESTGLSGSVTYTKDSIQPSMTSMSSLVPTFINASTTAFFIDVTLSEPVTNFSFSDFSVSNATGFLTPISSTQYQLTVMPLSDGPISINAPAASMFNDIAGNANLSGPFNVSTTYDSTAPSVTIASMPPSITNNVGGSFEVSASDATSGVTIVKCQLDGSAFVDCTSGAFLFDSLTDGNHVFQLFAIDNAGNSSSPISYNWNVDTVAPILSFTSTPNNPTNASNASFNISATESISSYICSADGVSYSSCLAAAPPFTRTGLNQGTQKFFVKGTDAAGNISAPISYVWVTDYTAPTVAIGSSYGPSTLPWVNSAAASVNFDVSYVAADTITLTSGQITQTSTGTAFCSTVSVSGSGSAMRTVSLSNCIGDGTVEISIPANTASDSAGNFAPSAGPSDVVNVDNIPPTFGGWIAPSFAVSGAMSGYFIRWNAATDSGSGLDPLPYTIQAFSSDGTCSASFTNVGPTSGTGYNWNFYPSTGLKSARVRMQDKAGNISFGPCSSTITASIAGKGMFETKNCVLGTSGNPAAGTTDLDCGGGIPRYRLQGLDTGAGSHDWFCQTAAKTAGLANYDKYIAYASDTGKDAYCRVFGFNSTRSVNCGQPDLPFGGGPWYRVKNSGGNVLDPTQPIGLGANDITALTSCSPGTSAGNNGSFSPCLANPINRDEYGFAVGGFVHTNSWANGSADSNGLSCWSSSSGVCMTGAANDTDVDAFAIWLGSLNTTIVDRHIYCIEK